MIDFSRINITGFAVHYVGNFGLSEDFIPSEEQFIFKDDFVKETLINHLLEGFKNDIYYHFRKKSDLMIYDVKGTVEDIFKDKKKFFDGSKKIAQHLYQQTTHIKVKGGDFYVAYINDVVVDGELCDAIGIFKSEAKETFIKADFSGGDFSIVTDSGMTSKLEKGVLIFNTDKEDGYKAVIIDNSSKIADAATYWSHDFLDMQLKESPYLHTSNYINHCVAFCEEVLTEENNVKKNDRMMILNNSVNFFDNNEEFSEKAFEKEILIEPELIDSFREHKEEYNKRFNIKEADNFVISKTAFKKYNRFTKSTIKLDNNFNIQIHSRHDYVEQGFDEEKGLKFYKLFYVNED